MKKYILVAVTLLLAVVALGTTSTFTWTGASNERIKNGVLKDLAYYTASDTGEQVTNWAYKGCRVTITVTDTILTPGVTVTLQGYNEAAASYYTVLASASITGEGTTNLIVYPGAAVTSNVSANQFLPHFWRLVTTHADGDSVKYALKIELIP